MLQGKKTEQFRVGFQKRQDFWDRADFQDASSDSEFHQVDEDGIKSWAQFAWWQLVIKGPCLNKGWRPQECHWLTQVVLLLPTTSKNLSGFVTLNGGPSSAYMC